MFSFRPIMYNRKTWSFFNHHGRFQSQLSKDLREHNSMKKDDHAGIETAQTIQNELWFLFREETLFLQTQENIVTIPTFSALKKLNLPCWY